MNYKTWNSYCKIFHGVNLKAMSIAAKLLDQEMEFMKTQQIDWQQIIDWIESDEREDFNNYLKDEWNF